MGFNPNNPTKKGFLSTYCIIGVLESHYSSSCRATLIKKIVIETVKHQADRYNKLGWAITPGDPGTSHSFIGIFFYHSLHNIEAFQGVKFQINNLRRNFLADVIIFSIINSYKTNNLAHWVIIDS